MVRMNCHRASPSISALGLDAVRAVLGGGRAVLVVVSVTIAVFAIGCQEEAKIERYRVPKKQTPPQRLLGAMVTHGEHVWFFKFLGPQAAVDPHEKEFERFMRSVRFGDSADQPVTWTLPEGWQEKPGTGLRYATLLPSPKDSSLELTVTQLGGSKLQNVNRWREQMGLPDVGEDELEKLTRDIMVDGKTVTLVDMKSEKR
ncbi:MAG TPA: hypothetical protein VKD72_19400 [Gemmataceae bacterium]|nr:hypothetical protein [Gemmataceae bacterium]